MKNKNPISIVIVNFRTPQLTISCLESIAYNFSQEILISVLIADNDSNDDSVNIIANEIKKRGWSSWVSILPLKKNGGFAYGNNRLIEKIFKHQLTPRYVWLLNPDTRVKSGACRALVDFLDENDDVGIVGSQLEDPNGLPLTSFFQFPTFISEFIKGASNKYITKLLRGWIVPQPISNEPKCANWLPGASIMVRKKVFDEIGLLDENYFMYFEEVDFCLRAWCKGWECWHVPLSKVVHIEGASSSFDGKAKKKPNTDHWLASRHYYFKKNYSLIYSCAADLFWLFGRLIWLIQGIFQKNKDDYSPFTAKTLIRHCMLTLRRR